MAAKPLGRQDYSSDKPGRFRTPQENRVMFEGPEKKFQRHIADYLIREHQYALLEQDDITDTEYYFAENHLIAFLNATQKETFITCIVPSFPLQMKKSSISPEW